ncbi:MAG: aminoacyl-tRNA hydrolase [Candidatus Uhrbacteria bacterium]
MFLIVGLGNPGKEYEKTRHNVGWFIIDRLAERLDATWKNKKAWKAQVAESVAEKNKVVMIKPETFMNRSGESVARARGFWNKTSLENIYVIHDDADLKLGDIRIKQGGSSAGHKGIDSITQKLGDNNFYRIRIGIGRPENDKMPLDKFVLGNFSDSEIKQLDQIADKAINEVITRIK